MPDVCRNVVSLVCLLVLRCLYSLKDYQEWTILKVGPCVARPGVHLVLSVIGMLGGVNSRARLHCFLKYNLAAHLD